MLNVTMFLVWVWKSIYQGCTIIMLTLYMFPENNFVNIIAITFTALVFTEWLNIVTEIYTFHILMGVSFLISAVIYIISILLM